MNEQSDSSVAVEGPARETEDERRAKLAATYFRDTLVWAGYYPQHVPGRRRKVYQEHFLKLLAQDAAYLSLEDLLAIHLVVNLWKRYPAGG